MASFQFEIQIAKQAAVAANATQIDSF